MTSILFLMICGLGWNLLLSCLTTSVTNWLCFSYFLLFIILKGYILNITTKKEITSTNLTMQDSIFCFSTYPPSSSSHSSLVCLTLPGTGYSNTCEDIDPKLNLSLYLLYLHSVKSWCEGFIDKRRCGWAPSPWPWGSWPRSSGWSCPQTGAAMPWSALWRRK